MASNKRAWGICDVCGWRYRHSQLKPNSFGLLVCPADHDGSFDLKNHPQNRIPKVGENPAIRNPRIDPGEGS